MKNKKKLVLFLAIIAVIVVGLQAWYDELLFTTITGGKGKANVIFVQDHTGSMCQIIYHPDFNVTLNTGISWQSDASIDDIATTFWYIRWYYQSGSTKRIYAPDSHTHLNLISASDNIRVDINGQYIKNGDWILQYDENDANNPAKQAVAKVTTVTPVAMGHPLHTTYYELALNSSTIRGTFDVNYELRIRINSYSASTMSARVVRLYGTNIDQGIEGSGYSEVGYVRPDEQDYLKWVFGVANDSQRQQISDFCTLGHDIDYNAYLRTTPIPPTDAYALDQNDSNKSETLLEEWNRVMKAIYPNRIANLQTNNMSASTTTIIYEKAKDTFKNYTPGGFYIKIDAETMWVTDTGHIPSTDPKTPDQGQLTVTRGQNGTIAAAHPSGTAIMIFNQTTSPVIDEYTPLTTLFSGMQHVDEPTGDVDTGYTDPISRDWDNNSSTPNTTKNCYRYKRVFTRIQVAREAICDVITAKNQLFKVADLAAFIDNATDTVIYCNTNDDFKNKVAPFFIKVIDPTDPASTEIMRVTANDPATYTLTVIRGSSPCEHNAYSAVMTYGGARDLVRFGIFDFPVTDVQGGLTSKLLVPLKDFGQKNADGTYKTDAYINSTILDSVKSMLSDKTTPLAKALSLVWNYLKPNANTGNPGANYIQQTSTGWDAVNQSYGFETIAGDPNAHPKGSPMEYWCQQNFAVMITDGVSNSDSELTSRGVFSHTNQKTAACAGIVNDYFVYDFNRSSYPTFWGDAVNDSTEYLTDVAYFMAHQDMFPTKKIKNSPFHYDTTNRYYDTYDKNLNPAADDTLYDDKNTDPFRQWKNNQNIQTYTVGLCIANNVLAKTAKNGNGISYTATNYRDLSEAFLSIITSASLSQTPMTYTTYAAPKQSITGGRYGYVAHFVPDNTKAMWEGHLRCFLLDKDGNFPNNLDEAAQVDDGSGSPVTSFQWDAAVKLIGRTEPRQVYTSKPNGSNWERKDFMDSEITYTDLGIASTQLSLVKNFTQNFNKADGTTDYPKSKLGDTFHFNPQVVGYPLAWKASFDASYKSFYDHYSTGGTKRTEVVYAGANDGKLHCFKAADGSELWSYVPYNLLKLLKDPALDNKRTYFIDGKSVVKDIKVDSLGDYRDWKTGLFFGLGVGGRAYCALDVTTPVDGSDNAAFNVLWEFNDSAETVTDGHMGFTEAKPVVVDMYGGSTLGKFPGVILPGGYNYAEVAATDMPAPAWHRREGKALYILNAATGAVVKKFIYGATDSNTATLNVNKNFLTAMTAAPALFDKNNDGIADVIYLAESGDYQIAPPLHDHGGAIWKINCYGDPLNWQAQKIYQADAGQTIFVSPSLAYDADYRVWVMFGTGRRPHPVEGSGGVFTNTIGQFVAFIDDNSSTAKTNADLHDAVTPIPGDYTIDDSGTVKKGFFFNFSKSGEIMYEPQPLYINYTVYFMTLVPQSGEGAETPSGDDPCGGGAANGVHYIYQFKLTSQGNTFTIGDVLIQTGKILGYGPMDDKFKLYIGDGTAGNFKPDKNQGTIDLKDNYTPLLWREEKK